MNNIINHEINIRVYNQFFSVDTCPDFTKNPTQLVETLSESSMKQFKVLKIDKMYQVTSEYFDYTVKDINLNKALCLACLASTGLSKDQLELINHRSKLQDNLL